MRLGIMRTELTFYSLITALAIAPVLLPRVICGDGTGSQWTAALAIAIAAAAAAITAIRYWLYAPMRKVSLEMGKFLKNGYKLDFIIPASGSPEARRMTASVNRVLLELGAYRAFHLNQVVEERGKAQALMDAISDGVLLLDERSRLIHANTIALRLLGIEKPVSDPPLHELVTERYFIPALTEIAASEDNYVRRELSSCPPAQDEEKAKQRHFRLISTRFTITKLKRPCRVIVIRDITGEKEMENAKETFFNMITHDMRSPVSSIQGYTQLLRNAVPETPQTAAFLGSIARSSARLRGMIDDILNTVKLESGTMQLRTLPVDATALCEGIVEACAPQAALKKISLHFASPPERTEVAADATLLERVIVNLIDNALKFTPRGGRITVSLSATGDGIRISVEDNGYGIPEGKESEIFGRYIQLEGHGHMGLGLGLAMCKMAVELHKGRIWVEPATPRGSRFIVSMPKKPE